MRGCLILLALLAAGCGTQETATKTGAAVAPTRCSVWLQGHLAEISFSSGTVQVQPVCDRWAQTQASAGQFWQENEVAAVPPDVEQLVCLLQDGPLLATVDDGEGAFYGRQACDALLAGGGWREVGH